MISLDTIYIHLTKQCNLRCCYCYFDASEKALTELTTAEIKSIIDDLPLLKPRRIIFTGGEPLLREDVFELAEKITYIDNSIILGITTNGLLIHHRNVRDLVNLFDEIRISIDGLREVNDRLRGNHSFDKVMNAFELVINAGGNPSAFITATALNMEHLNRFLNFLLQNGISKLHISPLKILGRARDENLLCDGDELKNIVNDFFYEKFGLPMENRGQESFNCGVGKFISINPDGSVYPCHVLTYPELCIGNIKNEKLSSIFFNSILINKLRNLKFNEISKCVGCFSRLSAQNSCLGMHVQGKDERLQLINYL